MHVLSGHSLFCAAAALWRGLVYVMIKKIHFVVERENRIGYNMNKILSIAGSDCSGGAGIQADLKTILAHGAYAMSVITALTAQNTTGVSDIMQVGPDFIKAQLEAVFTDILPDAVKIGMLPEEASIPVIGGYLKHYHIQHVVVDPVMAATSGAGLVSRDTLQRAIQELFSMAELLTPNLIEAEVLSGFSINSHDAMQQAAKAISQKFGCAVLCKGGHLEGAADDLLYDGGQFFWLEGEHIPNPNTHGTGCTLSSAVACNLASGMGLLDAVQRAKEYVASAILAGLDLGNGRGPLNHGYFIQEGAWTGGRKRAKEN